jgi:hypothetical protein
MFANFIGESMTLKRLTSLEIRDIVKDEKNDLVTYCHSILARWRKHFSQLFNVRGVHYDRKTKIHTAEPLVTDSSAFEIELAIEKLNKSLTTRY